MPARHTALTAGVMMALSTSSSLALDLSLTDGGTVDRYQDTYECADGRTLTVEYFSADPIFLAVLPPIDGEPLVFVQVMSGSGTRMAANQYIWWIKGNDATLYNLFDGPDALGVECSGTS